MGTMLENPLSENGAPLLEPAMLYGWVLDGEPRLDSREEAGR